MTTECPTCLRPLPLVDPYRPAPRTEGEALLLDLIQRGATTPRSLSRALIGDETRASVERARRRLEALTRAGLLVRTDSRDGSTSATYAIRTPVRVAG